MKILFITSAYPCPQNPIKGIFNYYRQQGLKALGLTVDILYLNRVLNKKNIIHIEKNYRPSDFGLSENSGVRSVNFLHPTLPNHLPSKVLKIVENENYDIVHFHFLWSTHSIASALRARKIPTVISCHGSDINNLVSKDQGQQKQKLSDLEGACKTIFVSKALLATAKSLGYSGKNATCIPNGFDPQLFNIKNRPKHFTAPLVGFVGALVPVKRVDALVSIFQQIKKGCPSAEFIIIGRGPLQTLIDKELQDSNIHSCTQHIHYLSPADLGTAMQKMTLLVLPSRNEGFPCVINEAKACGAPCIGRPTAPPRICGPAGSASATASRFSRATGSRRSSCSSPARGSGRSSCP